MNTSKSLKIVMNKENDSCSWSMQFSFQTKKQKQIEIFCKPVQSIQICLLLDQFNSLCNKLVCKYYLHVSLNKVIHFLIYVSKNVKWNQ